MPNQTDHSILHAWRRSLRLAAMLVAAFAIGTSALAQTESSGAPAPDAPARVGRISLISGTVTFTDYRANEESDATLNWPLTSQQRLSTGPLGRVEVRIGSTSIRLDGDSVIDFNRIDDEVIQVTLQRGTASVRVRNREQLGEIDFLTPRERVSFEEVGRYRIDVDRTPNVSAVTAHVGSARVAGAGTHFLVQSGQRGETSSDPVPNYQLTNALSDTFDDWVAARDRRDDSLQSTRYVNAETTGVESLDDHGQWRTVESYGAVWFPTGVVAGWAPYRYGRWAYVSPWGWTWIDDASWGFTPFHYGRWVYVGNAWGWVPGAYVARPCYAPALVAWYGSPGTSVAVSIGGPVGWFPLGPGEVFIPGYHYSRRYITSINYGHVTNITIINPPPHYRYRQPNYSTWAPGEALVRRQPINRVVQPAPNEWAKLPTQQHPPAKVTHDARVHKPTMVRTIAPAEAPRAGVPSQDLIRRPDQTRRVEAPVKVPSVRDNQSAREAQGDNANRQPITKVTPHEGRVDAPVQRVPRVDTPTRVDAPRREVPRNEAVSPVRPPKVQPTERPPMQSSGQIAAPTQQIAPRPAPRPEPPPVQHVAPRPMPRQEAPVQQVMPRPAPPVRPEAPIQRSAPVQREHGGESAQRPKVMRQGDMQRN